MLRHIPLLGSLSGSLLGSLLFCGCSMLPQINHQPTVHNPFPQLSKVAIAPFYNLSEEPTLNGNDVAMAYYNELQLIPGFEVTPPTIVEAEIQASGLMPNSPETARRLAQALGVDALVVGVVTDYSPYTPPRMTITVKWYAANPHFHKIPPGYGLPWGTPQEEEIPPELVMEAEMAFAQAQMATQTPEYEKLPGAEAFDLPQQAPLPAQGGAPPDRGPTEWGEGIQPQSYSATLEETADGRETVEPTSAREQVVPQVGLPSDWPDARGFLPPPPRVTPVTSEPNDAEPVLEHTRAYNGHDPKVTAALENYYYFRDDPRFGGWQSYLQRSDDFIRFCCHMHILEMLTARGGAGETRVVWRWPTIR